MRTGSDPFLQLARVASSQSLPDQPQTTFATLERAVDTVFGFKLFTVLLQREDGSSERVWTSHPAEYPLAGRKPRNPTRWSLKVLEYGEPFLGRTPQDIEEVFFDHELIASLGCGSVLNLPCIYRGRIVGTLNLLHQAEWYGEDDARFGMPFAATVAPLIADCFRD